MSVITTTVNRIAALFGFIRARDASITAYATRSGIYAVNTSMYDGSVYSVRANGGYLEDVLEAYVGTGYTNVNAYPVYPWFMPFKEIVETYQNVWPGTWGKLLKPVPVTEGETVNQRILEPLGRIWRDSNLDTEKQKLVRWAANFGTAGIRVVPQVEEGGSPARAVLTVDHPSRLLNFEEDSRGNCTAVALKWVEPMNFGTLVEPDWQDVEVIEELTKEGFSRTFDGKEQLKDGERRNTLGFCPYVIHRHKDNGTPYGDWAYKGSEVIVHRVNWRQSRQDKSLDRHQFPKWFGAGGGTPTTVEMGEDTMTFVKLGADTPTPFLQAIVGDIDQQAVMDFTASARDQLRGRQPELNFNDVKLLSNTSGETVAQVLKPTEQAILNVRPGYDHSLIRAMQMCLSAGVSVGAWDLGSGSDADSAFRAGLLNFALADRPALPETPQQQLVKAQAGVAERKEKFGLASAAQKLVNDPKELLMLAGYDEAEATRLAAIQPPPQPTLPGQQVAGNGGAVSPRLQRILGLS